MKKKAFLISFVLVVAYASGHTSAQAESPDDILVVSNNKAPSNSVSVGELRAFFLKKKSTWKGGRRVIPINAPEGSRLRQEFRRRVLKMEQSIERAYWQEQKIKHGIRPPPEFSHTQKAIFKLGDSVGYVFRSDFKQDVTKVLLVVSFNANQP